jgi:hypothetical protein
MSRIRLKRWRLLDDNCRRRFVWLQANVLYPHGFYLLVIPALFLVFIKPKPEVR